MSNLFLCLLLTLGAPTSAEITLPTPPKSPDSPKVDGAIGLTSASPEQLDAFTASIVRLDSLRTLENELKRTLSRLKTDQSAIREELIPATRLQRIYLQTEVDQKAYSIRRSLPSSAGSGNITVRFVVSSEGHPQDIEVVSPAGAYGDPVRERVAEWLYAPARKSNKRVPVRITVSMRLDED